MGEGDETSPWKSLKYAVNRVADGGTVTVIGDYDLANTSKLGVKGKTITITGGTLDLTEVSVFNVVGNIILDDITVISNGTVVYANGNELKVTESAVIDGYISEIYGGSNGGVVAETSLTLLAGNYTNIYGGGKNDTVLGDTNLYIGGNVNSGIDVSDHGISERVYGGSNNGSVLGDTNVTVADSAKSSVVYGGGNGADSIVKGSTNVTVNGGSVMGYYGGSYAGTVYNCNLVMNAGYVEQIFGGCQNTSMTGDTNITVNGGTITRRIYGGCYNEADYAIFSGPDYFTDYFVNGNTVVTIGANANYTHSGSQECAISAGSRNNINHSEENAILKFENNTVYSKVKSYVGSSLMEVDGYDFLYVAGAKI